MTQQQGATLEKSTAQEIFLDKGLSWAVIVIGQDFMCHNVSSCVYVVSVAAWRGKHGVRVTMHMALRLRRKVLVQQRNKDACSYVPAELGSHCGMLSVRCVNPDLFFSFEWTRLTSAGRCNVKSEWQRLLWYALWLKMYVCADKSYYKNRWRITHKQQRKTSKYNLMKEKQK